MRPAAATPLHFYGMSAPVTRRAVNVNLGCGPGPQPTDWVNVDGSWHARISKFKTLRRLLARLRIIPAENAELAWTAHLVPANLSKRLPFASGTVDCIYASHVFEHLYSTAGRALLRESHRILRLGGVIRLVVPDLRWLAERYLSEVSRARSTRDDGLPADRFVDALHLRPPAKPGGHFVFRMYSALTEFHTHKWMYDAESLSERLRTAGFMEVEERAFHESRISGIEQVEKAERVLDGAGICVEGVKSNAVAESVPASVTRRRPSAAG